MSEHPGDTATNRFRAFWAGLLAFVSFGAVLWLALQAAGPRQPVEAGLAERSAERAANLAAVSEAQTAALSPEAVTKAIPGAISALKGKPAAKSAIIVPGSPTFMKQSETPAPAPTPAAAPADKPAAPAPEKPAAPAPAAPAEKPAAPASEKPAAPAAPAPPAK